MKIYFGASISRDRSFLPNYRRIVAALKKMGHEVLSEYVVDPKLKIGLGLTPKELFKKETKTIERAEVMVAEVTVPSWGTAFLMEHALEHNKPVLALYFEEKESPLPMMVAGHPELYVDHYDFTNLDTVLAKNLSNFQDLRSSKKGKLVVIDGGDGSGKSTQTRLLLKYLDKHHIKRSFISFPRYHTSFHGKHAGRFLKGEFGGNNEVSPYLSSLAFALDRLTAREQIVEWLKRGKVVVADRYVSASLAHQGSKVPVAKRKAFLDWLYSMEYKEHKLPKEDVVIYLYVPVETAQKLMKKGKRKNDLADVDAEHQKRSIAMYKYLCRKYKHWQMIKCVDSKNCLLSIEEIQEKILSLLKSKKIVNFADK